jgi:quercetin dioxygenase-like cupin family protein
MIPGFRARFIHTERMTLALWEIDKGALLPEHSHPQEQVTQLLEGAFELVVNGTSHAMRAGDVLMIPPNAIHSGMAQTDCKILDTFSPPREDYRFPSADTSAKA